MAAKQSTEDESVSHCNNDTQLDEVSKAAVPAEEIPGYSSPESIEKGEENESLTSVTDAETPVETKTRNNCISDADSGAQTNASDSVAAEQSTEVELASHKDDETNYDEVSSNVVPAEDNHGSSSSDSIQKGEENEAKTSATNVQTPSETSTTNNRVSDALSNCDELSGIVVPTEEISSCSSEKSTQKENEPTTSVADIQTPAETTNTDYHLSEAPTSSDEFSKNVTLAEEIHSGSSDEPIQSEKENETTSSVTDLQTPVETNCVPEAPEDCAEFSQNATPAEEIHRCSSDNSIQKEEDSEPATSVADVGTPLEMDTINDCASDGAANTEHCHHDDQQHESSPDEEQQDLTPDEQQHEPFSSSQHAKEQPTAAPTSTSNSTPTSDSQHVPTELPQQVAQEASKSATTDHEPSNAPSANTRHKFLPLTPVEHAKHKAKCDETDPTTTKGRGPNMAHLGNGIYTLDGRFFLEITPEMVEKMVGAMKKD